IEEAMRWLPDDGTSTSTLETSSLGAPIVERSDRTDSDKRGESLHILLADDNADMRSYVRRLLSDRYEVTAVADGEAALRFARTQRPDLTHADVRMPGIDGLSRVRELRADPRTQELPVLLLSARAGEEARVEGLEAGADAYLVKPFSARELLARVASQLELARVRRDTAEALRESEERFRIMADNAPVIIWIADPQGRCTYLNEQWHEFTGTKAEQALGFAWLDSIHPDDRPAIADRCRSAVERREIVRLEYRLRRRDGEYRWAM